MPAKAERQPGLLAGKLGGDHPSLSLLRDTIQLRHVWTDLPEFLALPIEGYSAEMYDNSPIAQRFARIKEALPEESDLRERAERVLRAVHVLVYMRQTVSKLPHVPRGDADLIQGWVDSTIKGEELPILAAAMFPEWASRLDDTRDIPHITQANRWVADRVAHHLKDRGVKDAVILDAGAGTGKTIRGLRGSLRDKGIRAKITGVEISHDLAEKARANLKRGAAAQAAIREGNIMDYLAQVPDKSLDAFTMVYAIHHLSYPDQKKLLQLVYRKLKPGGVVAIADPTGRSNFNLTNLLINEPEAVFADFNATAEVARHLFMKTGFAVREDWQVVGNKRKKGKAVWHEVESPPGATLRSSASGDILKQGLLGYAVVGEKLTSH